MPDERFVAINVAGKGQVIFTACSHAGLINVLTCAQARFPDIPLYGVFGGFHLSGTTEPIIPETVAALARFEPAIDITGALHRLARGERPGRRLWRSGRSIRGRQDVHALTTPLGHGSRLRRSESGRRVRAAWIQVR